MADVTVRACREVMVCVLRHQVHHYCGVCAWDAEDGGDEFAAFKT